MTTTLLQQQANNNATNNATFTTTTATAAAAMAWSTEKLRFSCVDNISLKQLWKLIALDNNANANNTTTAPTTTTATAIQSSINNNNDKQQQQQQQQLSNNNKPNKNYNNETINVENCEKLANLLTTTTTNNNNNNHTINNSNANNNINKYNRIDFFNTTNASHSLLNFLAINALELSAPAAPVLIEQNQQQHHQQQQLQQQQQQQLKTSLAFNAKPSGWMQLSGHPESIVPTTSGIVHKRVTSASDSEVLAYQQLSTEAQACKIVPHFYGTHELNGEHFIELQDLLHGFKDPCVMDIKLGTRTFLESEVNNKALRADLYQKMLSVDANAPTAEEHAAQAITKLRYMLFREQMSSSHTKGFRIEALRLRGRTPVKDLKMVRTSEQIAQTIEQFVGNRRSVHKELIKRLKQMRSIVEKSTFFQRHEIIGSSVFIVYDDTKVNVWMIDFAKSRALPDDITVTHRTPWTVGNREEGLLKGMDELINSFEEVYAQHGTGRKCLQI